MVKLQMHPDNCMCLNQRVLLFNYDFLRTSHYNNNNKHNAIPQVGSPRVEYTLTLPLPKEVTEVVSIRSSAQILRTSH